ncbi:iron-containing alcohol dehydrogenase family protein [Prochlorothrix hollandica]|uniref:Oxidoreductase n=1 Tax=Prochlorothrix hollandica PCC 9006 = CALU 1027 TaxID=317619 RepID=A0A0M2PUN3_PROHO|nr:iron-containing alcohol dehydrogenase family protein [Prochlorothrix hollandica]KKI98081.1 oxidoreductase [Prochlorothrix hollandica PCC 9006 = CALU 1027]
MTASCDRFTLPSLAIAPAQILRGTAMEESLVEVISRWGPRSLGVGGDRSLALCRQHYPSLSRLDLHWVSSAPDCSESVIDRLRISAQDWDPQVILGVGGGKALDTAKLLAHHLGLPVITLPTSAATCAAWTALSNVYSESGAFRYDVALTQCPQALVLDYDLIQTAPRRTLVAGIGDALAKWYEASVSSGHSNETLIIGAVQQARILRDILFQQAGIALEQPGSDPWRQVVDAVVLMAGVIGGLGGAQCRTVAAHAVHNGLTQLAQYPKTLHGEKVAYGILVQLRLEETVLGNQLAATARQQLLKIYQDMGLPCSLADLGLGQSALADLEQVATFACLPGSDIHHLPFPVDPTQLLGAMVSTTAPVVAAIATP